MRVLICTDTDGSINFFKEQTDIANPAEAEWLHDYNSSEECTKKIGLQGKGEKIVENHISPDGRYILSCTEGDGLRVLEFKKERTFDHEVIYLQDTDWEIPLKTQDIDGIELATRVRFESNNVIRFVTTETNRDLLYCLDEAREQFHYMSEVRVENLFEGFKGHKIAMQPLENEFEKLIQSNRLFRTNYWHTLNLDARHLSHTQGVLCDEDKIKRVDMITPVIKCGTSFQAQLSFSTFEWLQAEKVAAGDINMELLSEKRRLQLTLGIFPQANTLLHLIADRSSKEDQS